MTGREKTASLQGDCADAPITTEAGTDTFDYAHWHSRSDALQQAYQDAGPFPHAILDDFLFPDAAHRILAEFQQVNKDQWTHYLHVNERKLGNCAHTSFGPSLSAVVNELNSPRFIAFLESLTGITELVADPSLVGGGLHETEPGGFLNLHADFTVHPYRRNWRRRINLIIYLNDGWQDEWRGHLELWDTAITRCVQRVSPIFNRAVIFNTDESSFHGHPDALACPPGISRKSLAFYYYTEQEHVHARSTEYRPRPDDGLVQGVFVYADKMALRVYDRVKRRFKLDDRWVSRTLIFFSKFRKK